MEKNFKVWSKRQAESKVHRAIRDFGTYWPCDLSIGTPSGVGQITRCVSCVDASEIAL